MVVKFNKHKGSYCHKDAILSTVTLPATTNDASEWKETAGSSNRWQQQQTVATDANDIVHTAGKEKVGAMQMFS